MDENKPPLTTLIVALRRFLGGGNEDPKGMQEHSVFLVSEEPDASPASPRPSNLTLLKPEGVTYIATKCGHRTLLAGPVSAFGRIIKTEIMPSRSGSVDYCLDCLGKMAIRCTECGQPIFVGDPITLFTPLPDAPIPTYAVVHQEKPLQLVGCFRDECADSGGDIAGFWLPSEGGKGRVERRPTAFETILGIPVEATLSAPQLVLVKDTSPKG